MDDDTAWQIAIGGLSGDPNSQATIPGLASITEGGAIDQEGKADDAIDFEDVELSDDELPDEEEPGTAPASNEVPGLTEGDTCTSNDTDDLFGDPQDSSPLDLGYPHIRSSPHPLDADSDEARLTLTAGESIEDLRELNFDLSGSTANQDPDIPAPPESTDDLVKLQWPDFHKNAILNYNELFRSKPATWIAKKPAKPPKPLIPTKLSLEVDIDQEKLFRIPGPATAPVWQKIRDAEARGLVCLEEPEAVEPADLEIFTFDDESDTEPVGGFTLRDFETLCDDWEGMVDLADQIQSRLSESGPGKRPIKDEDAAWEEMFLDAPAPKRRKIEPPRGLPAISTFTAPNFDNFEEATVKLGKRVILDMNDPYLLIDDKDSDRTAKRRKVQHKMVRMSNGKLGRELQQRFNYSNDVAYEALKENNSNRVRATIAAIPVEHSMPAIRLQWPYYKVKLSASDPHSYHRPQLQTRQQVSTVKFSKPTVQKRKALKGKRIRDIFRESKDLSMNDNSTAVLFEYCEEIPTVLSNFGMGSKIVNYFRRSKGSDSRPDKQDLGENCILLPEDRSPFAIFGHVHPGETVPTFHTQMYRAPIFKHTPRGTDFLIGRSTTGLGGSTWYIRNIDHLYVVGQTLPSMEVPGPHSRRVTNIAKNRLKMVSYRLLRKHPHVTLSDITKHVADSNDSQNRQKLKEFLRFRKDTKDWALPEGEEPMDEEEIRSLVKPEEVCVLDAMQVGVHELENGGYQLAGDTLKDEDLDMMGDDIPADALAQKMVPWKTTKAFIDASYGKAMLAIHGPGDPTGRGLGISFLKTSMKGGFLEQLQGPLATSADAIERQKKANGGHMYNVKNQDQLYAEAITDIWNRQRQSLEDSQEHDDEDVQPQEDEDDRFNVKEAAPTPAVAEGASQISRSAASALNRRKLHITRTIKRPDGKTEQVTEIVHDPAVIAQYVKRRRQQDVEEIDIYNYKLTGDNEKDRVILELVEKERERLEKNKERRHKREKQKKMLQGHTGGGGGGGGGGDGSPEPTTEKVTGTTRKCANCGQIGHIKTNKKLCPLLNGTIQKDPNMDDGPGLGGSAPVAAHFFGTG
ncbi:transcription initiation factor tfiid-like protein [Coniochaeta sp. PMI_546]|nr:transcription initiation factor tfiid-like protein [Coniochaeta sp. PMI_546]